MANELDIQQLVIIKIFRLILFTAVFMAFVSTVATMTLTDEAVISLHTLAMATASHGKFLLPVRSVESIREPWLSWRRRLTVMRGEGSTND